MFKSDNTPEGSKEQLILEAAMEEFIEMGWSGARMQSIADRAGINKTLLHYYFRSKEKLYERTLARVMDYFFGTVLGNVGETENFASFLTSFIDTVITKTAENPKLPLFILQELSRSGAGVRSILGDVMGKQTPPLPVLLPARIGEAVKRGEIREVDPVQFILTLLGSCFYFAMAEPVVMEIASSGGLVDGDFDRAAFLEERKQAVFDVLYNGITK